MKPEASRFLDKAMEHLDRAAVMLGSDLPEDAGRAAYLAGFHAAQAFIFESTGKVVKSHNGVQAEFLRLTKDCARLDADHRAYLSRTYNLKAIADYETGKGSKISADRAARAVEEGKLFVSRVFELLSSEPPQDLRFTET